MNPMHGDVLHPHTRPQENAQEAKPAKTHPTELKQSRSLPKKFEKLSAEIGALVGNKLKGHRDGDAERLVFEQ